jgi:hypothetical protein
MARRRRTGSAALHPRLRAGRGSQSVDFISRQFPPLPRLQLIISNRSNGHTAQALNRMADRVAHVPDLTVPAFMQRDAEHAVLIVAPPGQQFDVRRCRAAPFDHHAARQTLEIMRIRHPEHACFVHTLDAVPRVRETRRKIAVVGQNEQPL